MLNFKNKTEPPITELDFIDDGYDIETIAKIQPQGGIEFKERYFRTGSGYTTAITIYELPKVLNDNWLDPIINQAGIVAVFDTISIDRHEAIKKINRSIGEQATRKYEKTAKTLDKLEANDTYQSLLDLGSNIKIHGEIMKRVVIRLYLTKSTEQELEIFVKNQERIRIKKF